MKNTINLEYKLIKSESEIIPKGIYIDLFVKNKDRWIFLDSVGSVFQDTINENIQIAEGYAKERWGIDTVTYSSVSEVKLKTAN